MQISRPEFGQHAVRETTYFVQRFHRRPGVVGCGLFLLLENGPGMMSGSREKQHQVRLQFAAQIGIEVDWLYMGDPIGPKGNEIQTPESGSEFILPADLTPKNVARDMECAFRKFVLGKRLVQVGANRLEDIDADTRGGTQTCARGNLRGKE